MRRTDLQRFAVGSIQHTKMSQRVAEHMSRLHGFTAWTLRDISITVCAAGQGGLPLAKAYSVRGHMFVWQLGSCLDQDRLAANAKVVVIDDFFLSPISGWDCGDMSSSDEACC